MNWITKLWKWICGLFTSKKLHKCVCRSTCCCDRSSMLVVYDETDISDDSDDSDIEINSERESIKVK